MDTRFKILFLCTGNSARSILAEYLLRKMAPQRFDCFSAGSHPKKFPHSMTLKILKDFYGMDTTQARSKSWEELKNINFDFVITVCDNAKETCPVWAGHPIIAHWSSPDPAAFEGDEKEQEQYFLNVARQINRRLELFTSLPFDKLDALRLTHETREIGLTQSTLSPINL